MPTIMRPTSSSLTAIVWSAIALLGVARPAAAASCESLASLSLPAVTVTAATSVAAGAFAPPAAVGRGSGIRGAGPTSFSELPAFCRVAATLRPSADSDIKIEVWLPAAGWNGKLEAVGNGGWAGTISYPALGTAIAAGYASASTDTGHVGGSGSFALGHPEKLIDFGYRAVHEMTVAAKAMTTAFYGEGPKRLYWNGCSTGGKQGLAEAQRYPADFDGIIAGASANAMMRIHVAALWIGLAVHGDDASYIPPEKYRTIHDAVMGACDAIDGVKDGLIADPRRCRFDPKTLECRQGDGPSCLTARQVDAARKIYAAVRNPRTGKDIAPGLEPGSELGWAFLAGPQPTSVALDTFKYIVFENPAWNFHAFNFDTDVARADAVDRGTNNALDPNLRPFFDRGGKLLMYHGWSDPNIAPRNSIEYYGSVQKALGGESKTRESMRLFMFPGMAHCGGGEGPNSFDAIGALDRWVENHQAPDQILASHRSSGVVDRTRPVCAYPQVAAYRGAGSIDDAASFVCRAP